MTQAHEGSGSRPTGGRRLLVSGAQFSIGPLTRAVGVLLLLPLTTRVLSSDELGLVSTAQVITNILLAVAAFGLHSAAMREYFGNETDAGSPTLARSLSLAAVIATVIVATLAHLTGSSWSQAVSGVPYGSALILSVVVIIPMSVHVVAQNLLRAEHRPLPFGIAALVATLGGQLLGIAIAVARGGTATDYLTGVLIGFAVGALISAGTAGLTRQLPTRSQLIAGLRLGLPTIPHSLGIFLLQVGDRLVINDLLGLAAVGRYQVAYLVGSSGIMLIMAFSAAWTPMIFGIDRDDERWNELATSTGLVHRLIGLISVGLILLAPLVLKIAAPASYDTKSLVPVVLIVAPSAAAYVTFQASSMVLFHLRRTGPLGLTSLVAAVVNLGLNLMLVNSWGLKGAAAATTITYILWAFAVRSIAARVATVDWHDRELAGAVVAIGASAAVSAVVGLGTAAIVIRLVLAAAAGVGVITTAAAQR